MKEETRGLDAQWLYEHASVVKDVINAVISEEMQEDIAELKGAINTAVDIVFDILHEPFAAAGIDLQRAATRSLFAQRMKALALKKLAEFAEELLAEEEEIDF